MNAKYRKCTMEKHLEISEKADKSLKNITKSLNKELDGKYYEWQVFEIAIILLEKQLQTMDSDRKCELLKMTGD